MAPGDHNEPAAPNCDANNVGEDDPTAESDAHVLSPPPAVADLTTTPADHPPNADDRPLPDAPDGDQHGAVVHDASAPAMQNPTSPTTTLTPRPLQNASFVQTPQTMRSNLERHQTSVQTANP